jgi:F0F1-type ATP synthase gamma subunit
MGAQLRVFRRRIRSVQATKKITKAMELIASSRIVKAQQRLDASMPYLTQLLDASLRLPPMLPTSRRTRSPRVRRSRSEPLCW